MLAINGLEQPFSTDLEGFSDSEEERHGLASLGEILPRVLVKYGCCDESPTTEGGDGQQDAPVRFSVMETAQLQPVACC